MHRTTDEIINTGSREELVDRLRYYIYIAGKLEKALHGAIKALEKLAYF